MEYRDVVGGGPGFTNVVGADGRNYTVRGTFGFRNNNPGNIRDSDFARRHGAIGASGGFAVFSSYDAGRAAKEALMFGPSYSGMTLRQAITKYAPPNENNTGAYVNTIAKALGISPNTNLSDLSDEQRSAMLDTMQDIEGYRPGPVTNEFGERVDPGIMSAMFDAPTPTEAPRFTSAVPGEVERAELADVPSGLLGPSVTAAQGYGQLAETMGETPALNLAGAMPASPVDRMAPSAPVAQGLDGLRAGLLSQQPGSMYASQPQMADMQDRANLMNDVNEARASVTPPSAGLMSFAEAPTVSPAATAIETASPSPAAAAPSAASLASAYGQLGQTLDQANVLGLSGQKLYDPNAPMGELQSTGLLSAAQAPTQEVGDYQDPSVSVQGPVSPAVETQQGPTPPGNVGSFPAAPEAPSTFGSKAKTLAGTVAGGLLGSAAAGPIGGLLGGLLGREMATGKGLFSSSAPAGAEQGIRGLLSGSGITSIGSGPQASYSVWGGGTPTGSQAMATDGSRITSLGRGLIARTDPNGVTTTFNDRGNIVGSPASTGGLLAGIGRDISDAFGGGNSSGGGGVDTSGMSPGLW